MWLFEFCVARKKSVITLMLLLLLCGIHAYINIAKEGRPDIKIPMIYVIVTQRGISPEDAKKMILQPLETGLQGLENVKQITSYAYDGAAAVQIEFHAGADSKKSLDDVRNKVNDSKHDLPKEADEQIVKQIDLSLIPVLNVVLSSDIPQRELLRIARDTKDKIEKISYVREVNIGGNAMEAVQIIIKPEMLERYHLSTGFLQQIINSNNVLVTAGAIKKHDGEYVVKIPGLIKDYTTLVNFPVSSKNGTVIQLKDIAEVKRDFKDTDSIARVNGKRAVVLEVSKQAGANVMDTVKTVKDAVETAKQQWSEDISVTYANDDSEHIIDMVFELENGIIFAALLVMIIIIMSVGIKSAILIAFSLPVSFFVCILVMDIYGYTLNIVVLFSLILTVGMVVDDAIVVTEYADRKMIEGASSEVAYLEAAKRMFVPIFTATLVKIVVFLPFLMWPGVLGQFMKYMPITVLIIMTNSIVFALLFQPAIGSMMMKKHAPVGEDEMKAIVAAESGPLSDIKGVIGRYMKLLDKLLAHPKIFVFGTVGLMVTTIGMFSILGTGVEFFPDVEPDNATIIVRSAGNLSIHQKNAIMMDVEKQLFKFKDGISVFYTKVGRVGASHQLPEDTIGTVDIEFSDWKHRKKASIILDEIERSVKTPGAIVQVNKERQGPSSGKPIQLSVTARDYANAMDFARTMKEAMENDIGGFKDIDDSLPVSGIEWYLEIDKVLAAKYLVSVIDVGNLVQMATSGLKISTCRLDDLDYEVDILLRMPESSRITSKLTDLRIVNMNGDIIPINKFVEQKAKPQLTQIKRIDRENVVTIDADVKPGYLVDSQVKLIQKWLNTNTPDNVKVTFKGEAEDQKEAATFLRNAFFFVLAVTFMIMLTQFNDFYEAFVVMTAVFLSITGVLIGLMITGRPFNIVMCGIGIIALAGIVLNNNILMVDTFNHLKRQNFSGVEAIMRAGAQRIRPILLTALAAVLGLLPMATRITLNFFGRSVTYDAPSTQWWTQLATSICGGLTFATVLTLFFTPCLLALKYKKK